MQGRIEDTVTVITGASSGIGRATALAFAKKGGTVAKAARALDGAGRRAGHRRGVRARRARERVVIEPRKIESQGPGSKQTDLGRATGNP